MENGGNILSKENSLVLRGLAILAILFHNHLHWAGFCMENEGSFEQAKADAFFRALAHPGWAAVFDAVSFLGWIGVPVFVFLTGYGLAVKHPPEAPFDAARCLKNAYLKLFFLLLPASLLFTAGDILLGDWSDVAKRVVQLSMLSNLGYPFLSVDPNVYWYFSLTFQFYVVYCFGRRWFKPVNLLLLSVLSLAALLPLAAFGEKASVPLRIYKACFPGWFPPFALGLWFAWDDRPKQWLEKAGLLKASVGWIVLSILVVAMNARLVPWLLVPVAGLFAFFALGRLVLGVRPLAGVLKWVGSLSACVFVCHPIVRKVLFLKPVCGWTDRIGDALGLPRHGLLVSLAAYAVSTFVLAWFYRKLQKRLSGKFADRGGPPRAATGFINRAESARRSGA